ELSAESSLDSSASSSSSSSSSSSPTNSPSTSRSKSPLYRQSPMYFGQQDLQAEIEMDVPASSSEPVDWLSLNILNSALNPGFPGYLNIEADISEVLRTLEDQVGINLVHNMVERYNIAIDNPERPFTYNDIRAIFIGTVA